MAGGGYRLFFGATHGHGGCASQVVSFPRLSAALWKSWAIIDYLSRKRNGPWRDCRRRSRWPKYFQKIKGQNGGHESQWMPISAACGGRGKFNFPPLIARHFLKSSHKDQARLGRYWRPKNNSAPQFISFLHWKMTLAGVPLIVVLRRWPYWSAADYRYRDLAVFATHQYRVG